MKQPIQLMIYFTCVLCALLPTRTMAQDGNTERNKKTIKFKKLNLGEKLGDIAGKLMTSETADLASLSPVVTITSGMYNLDTKTSESKYLPTNTREGDHTMSITFMKNEGVGISKIKGTVNCEGAAMEYLGLGSYYYTFDAPLQASKKITVTTETGQKASYELEPIPEVEIISINGDETFPIIDLREDMRIRFTHPTGADGTNIKIGLLTDIMGARAWNYFAEFKSTDKEIVIPKESFSNLEISGALNAGQVNRGLTYIVVMREKVLEASEIPTDKVSGPSVKPKFQSTAYGTKQVLVKGKQEEGVIAEVKFSGKYKDKLAYSIYKPNATSGIPFSRGSKFGLATLVIQGKTYKKDTETGSKTWDVGDTRYTSSWTKTTTYQFPQLPDAYWEKAMDNFYQSFNTMMNKQFSIAFTPVENVTSSASYISMVGVQETNTSLAVAKSYENTKYITPQSFGESWANRSSSTSAENPSMMLMKEQEIDGLVSLQINFDIGANSDGKVVLLPTVTFSIKGRDETKENKTGTYADGYITFKEGIPFDAERLHSDPNYLTQILNVPSLISGLEYMLVSLREKEVQLGFDKIWSIGE